MFQVQVSGGKSFQTNLTTEIADEAIYWFISTIDALPEYNVRIVRNGDVMCRKTKKGGQIFVDWADRLKNL